VTVPFAGVGVALVTLFDDRGEIDPGGTADLAARLVEEGVQAVVVAGTTGEAPALSSGERVELIAAVRRRVEGEAPVIAGTGAASARQAVTLTRQARDAGADAFLVLSPPRSDDPREYYREVRGAAGDRPVLAYHFPRVSAPGIPVELLSELAVDGVKDSSGDPDRLLATVESYAGAVYVGSSALLVQAGAMGCAGAILALANAEPTLCVAAFGGDGDAQRDLAVAHLRSKGRPPWALKEMVSDRYGTSPVARMG
jgi:4-hydroxy-tetrahydrodipicolinate synthase